jgi:hypothetical protein
LEVRQVGQPFVFSRSADQVIAQHLERAFGRLAAGPEVDQQAGDDRAVRLNLDPVGMMAPQMPAAQQVLERAEAATGGSCSLRSASGIERY